MAEQTIIISIPHNLYRCSNNVIDRFGKEINLSEDNERYVARVKANPAGVRCWALQYLPYVEVLEPKCLRDEIVEIIKNKTY